MILVRGARSAQWLHQHDITAYNTTCMVQVAQASGALENFSLCIHFTPDLSQMLANQKSRRGLHSEAMTASATCVLHHISNVGRSPAGEASGVEGGSESAAVCAAICEATWWTVRGELRACLKPPAKRFSSTCRSGFGRGISKEKLPSSSIFFFLTGSRTRSGPS